jgi:hypothetical protein
VAHNRPTDTSEEERFVPKPVLLAALRVLKSFNDYAPPDPSDVEELQRSVAGNPEANWEPDLLACHIVDREVHTGRPAAA